MTSRALVVFSGGQDSTTCLYWARKKFDAVECLTFDYGQRHRVEIECAVNICKKLGVPQTIVPMSFLAGLNSNALTDQAVAVHHEGGVHNLPSTFVPGRNILFLTLAAAYAVPRGISDLVIGVCQADYSGYPDCREEFVASMEHSLRLGMQQENLAIHRPLMNLTKGQIFKLAEEVGGLESVRCDSHTCYEGDHVHSHEWGFGCGKCPACELRRKGWEAYKKGM